jgi:prophage tail gpP-like protein
MFNQPVQDKVLVKINGQDLTGWTEASITAGIERIPRYGRLSVTWETNQGLYKNGNKPLAPLGLPITVSLGSEKVLTGYMDVSSDRVSEGEHSITYNVRGASCDLVDSTAEFFNQNQQGTLMSELYNVTILQAVSKMSSVYNVNVISTNPLTNTIFPGALNINVGDAAFTEIDYLAKFTGSLIYENANGDLVLGLPGTEPASTTFLTHMNVLSSEFINDITGIYSEYEIFAQSAIENTDIPNLPTNHMSIGAVLDNFFENRLSTNGSHRVRKYRKIQDLTLSSDIYNRNSDFNFNPQQLYAQWLANRNKGHAQCMEVEVFGWR